MSNFAYYFHVLNGYCLETTTIMLWSLKQIHFAYKINMQKSFPMQMKAKLQGIRGGTVFCSILYSCMGHHKKAAAAATALLKLYARPN